MSICETETEERFNPFSRQGNTLELGKVLELRDVFEKYLKPSMQAKRRKEKTIKGIDRQIRQFEAWWIRELMYWRDRSEIEIPRPVVASLTIQHLSAFQRSQLESGRSAKFANSAVATVRQVLRCAERHGLITHSPRVESIPAPKAAPKVYMTHDHLAALWETAPDKWPTKTGNFQPLHYSPQTAWRCCLILWTLYGFRTQELVALESKSSPLKWSNIHTVKETPNPAGYTECDWGWLVYVPPKQSWIKPEPLYLPLTMHARAAFEVLRPKDWRTDRVVCDWTLSSTSFYATWHAWTARAGLVPKVGSRFQVKHLRKTCATMINDHKHGLAEYITGHASDRSGSGVVASSVAKDHYVNAEQFIIEGLMTLPVPDCFYEILKTTLQ